jgi:hypothetical protein
MMNLPENIFIKHAKYIADYRIAFLFTDGHSTEVDFHNFLAAPGQNPMASQFLDVIRVKKFKVENRSDIIWGDWEMCFPFAALYAGDLGVDSLGNRSASSKRGSVRKGIRQAGASRPPARTKGLSTMRPTGKSNAK